MSQLILPEVEHGYPEGTLVAIEEEPRILQGIEIADNVRLPCRRIALCTHDGNLLALACHVNHNQGVPHPLQFAGWIDKYIARLYLTDRARLCLTAHREGAATPVCLAKETLQRLARSASIILQPMAIHISEPNLRIPPPAEEILTPDSHRHIRTLFRIAQHRNVNHPGR